MDKDEIAQCLKNDPSVMGSLTYREREIIKLRYGIADGYTYTLEEVSNIYKVTRERVRQVEAKAIRKLKNCIDDTNVAECCGRSEKDCDCDPVNEHSGKAW